MRAEKVIYALLTADAGVAALVGTRIYPSRLPQNTVMPALVYDLVSAVDLPPINAASGAQIVRARVQVTALGKVYADIKGVLDAVRTALLYKSGLIAGVRVISILRDSVGPDLRDDALNQYMQHMDFMVTFQDQ